jgi:hypothetical protein
MRRNAPDGARFTELFDRKVVVFICAEFRKNLAVLSSTIAEALAIDTAVFYAGTWIHVCEIHSRKDHRGAHLVSDAPLFGRLWHGGPNAVYDAAGNLIKTHKHTDDYNDW